MSDDFDIKPGLSYGTWLHDEIASECVIERTGWAPERVTRVADRLQAGRAKADLLEVVVAWLDITTAFTAPGSYIYFTRRLLEQCPDDETAAFVIGHEIAHHDLGHLKLLPHWLSALARVHGGWLAAAVVVGLGHRLYGPERECAADRRALELCLAAGYDPVHCLQFLDVMERIALDVGDQDMVFGPDAESDEELSDDASLLTKARIWTWQRSRGYLPIQDRRAALLHHLANLRNGSAVGIPLTTPGG